MSEKKNVLYSEDGAVAVISLNRPDVTNASSFALREELSDCMDKAEKNQNIRVVILTGEGPSFGAGADLTESFVERRGTVNEHILKDHSRLIDNIARSDKAYIAALGGATAGVKLAYAMACDMIIMSEDAYLYSPFAAISLVPDGGATWFLLRAFGYQKAFEIITELKRVTAGECLDAGLANQVVPVEELRQVAMDRAQKLASKCAPLTLKYGKKVLRRALNTTREEVTNIEADFQHICISSKDFNEGVTAFMEKRKPEFKGE